MHRERLLVRAACPTMSTQSLSSLRPFMPHFTEFVSQLHERNTGMWLPGREIKGGETWLQGLTEGGSQGLEKRPDRWLELAALG